MDLVDGPATLALFVADVVNSTALVESLGEVGASAAWADHDAAARALLPDHGGREIDKTDGFLLVFPTVAAATAYAADYHAALASLPTPMKARAGVHFGEVVLRTTPEADVVRGAKPVEVDGLAKPVAARTMSVALGGQTLLTPEARTALGPVPDGFELLSHGHWRMKGVTEPVELFEVGRPGEAPLAAPPDGAKVYRVVRQGAHWVPVREVPHSLRTERDRFVGRQSDLEGLEEACSRPGNLVTLLGTGGTGKTRLVTHFGWSHLGDFPGGVWFCDLSEARSEGELLTAVAAGLGVSLTGSDAHQALVDALARRGRCLVVFDNFEQVVHLAAQTVDRWRQGAADAVFLVTSREVLGLPGEQVLPLAPLDPRESMALFVERGQRAKRGWTPDDPEAIARLVALLDHIPLAIELAAARLRVLPVAKIADRLRDRFKLLAGGRRGDRHGTLRATIDWSWNLLEPWEQAALAQLSVFEGGFTLDAVEAVADLDPWPDAPWPLDVVQSLVDKSLVVQRGEERFGMLVSIQEYAREKLQGVDREAAILRHLHWFAADDRPGPERRPDNANLVAAMERALDRDVRDAFGGLLDAVFLVLARQGPLSTLSALLERLYRRTDLDPETRLLATARRAHTLGRLGTDEDLAASLHAALAAPDAGQSPRGQSQVLQQLGWLAFRTGDANAARAHGRELVALAETAGLVPEQVLGLTLLGVLRAHAGDGEGAAPLWQRAVDLAGPTHQTYAEGARTNLLILRSRHWGDPESIDALIDEAHLAKAGGDPFHESQHLDSAVGSLLARGDHQRAGPLIDQLEAAYEKLWSPVSRGSVELHRARRHRILGELDRALACIEHAEAIYDEHQGSIPAEAGAERARIALARGEPEEASALLEEAESAARLGRDALALAATRASRVQALLALGRRDEARSLADRAWTDTADLDLTLSRALTRQARGRCALADGEVERALTELTYALEEARSFHSPLHRARVQLDLAEVEQAADRDAEAQGAWEAARALITELDLPRAAPLARRLRSLARHRSA